MQKTNLNVSPYYDDFSEDSLYHRVLFRPAYSVQARELTQMQTILQNQIERIGSHFFKEGSVVDAEALYTKNLISKKNRPVKLLGYGELEKALTIKVNKASASAIKAVEAKKGTVELIAKTKKQTKENA